MAPETVDAPARAAEPSRGRPFGLSDLMIVLAGAAIALAGGTHLLVFTAQTFGRLVREAVGHRADLLEHWPLFWGATHDHLRNTLWYGLQAIEMALVGMTPAFVILRSRRPRPRLRSLLRQPGTAAALAMVFGLFWGTGMLHVLFPGEVDSVTAAPIAVGGAVAAAWGVLAFSGHWESAPGWIDRVGRLLGCAAVVAALLALVVHRI